MKCCMKCKIPENEIDLGTLPIPLIKCDSCINYLCEKCCGLGATELRCITLKKRKMMFLCNECEEGLLLIPKLIKKINEMQNQIDNMSNKLENINSHSNNNDSSVYIPESEMLRNESIIQELHERQIRASNVIMLNVSESKKDNQQARSEEDTTRVQEIIENTGVSVSNLKTYRLGRYIEGKMRPIKIILPDQFKAIEILKNRNKVKNIPIFSDKTKMQQNHYKQLKEKLNEINKNGGNKIIKYIKNMPTIVDKSLSNEKNI